MLPSLESTWIETYVEGTRTGEGRRFDDFSSDLRKWFEVFVFPLPEGGGHRLRKVALNTWTIFGELA